MRVLVTGGSGFLGGYVVPRLAAGGYEVGALARSAAAAARVEQLGATAVPGDLDDPARVDAAFGGWAAAGAAGAGAARAAGSAGAGAAGAGALVNLASLGFGHAPTIVAAAEEAGLTRAVFVSTTAIFTGLDARSKRLRVAAEDTIRASALEWTILRPTMIYGAPGDRNMARLVRLVRRSPVVPLPGGGRGLQQPVHVEDVAGAVVAALLAPGAVGRAYDLAGPVAMQLREVVGLTAGAAGRRPRVLPLPLGPAVLAARIYERASRRPRLRAEQVERLAEDKVFAIEAARRDLGFDPRPFAVGIAAEAAALA